MPATPPVSPALQKLLDKGLLDRLPVSFSAFCFDQMKDWALLFPAERSYYERLFGMLDYTDEVFWWGTLESEDDARAIVYRHKQAGFGRVYWRVFGSHLDNSLAVPEAAPRWTGGAPTEAT